MHRRTLLTGTAAAFLARPSLAQPAAARVLKYVPQSDLTVTDPVMTTAYITRTHGLMIWDQLYGLDAELRPRPQMVEGHTVEDDGRRWTFRLREGLVFHDGEPVRGRDCIASIRRWAQRDSLGQALMARLDEMSAPDDRSFVIRLRRPYGAMLDALAKVGPSALFVMPERLAATEATTPIREIIGSGPFRWKADERVVGARAVYERFDRYRPREESGLSSWAAGPKRVHFDRVEWHVMPDPGTATSALTNGEVDWWENPTNDLLPILERNRNIATQLATPLGTMGTGIFNHLHAPFDKAAVRRVVMEAMSQEDCMIAAAGTDPALYRTGVGIFTPGTPMASTEGLEPLTRRRDMETLRKALAEAGYKGERVVLMIPTDQAVLAAIGEVCLDTLRRLGMNVEPAVSDWGTLVQRRASKAPPEQGGWNMFNTTWAGLDMINPVVQQVLRANGERAFFGWPSIPRIEELREAWLDAPDLATQQRICAELQQVALREVPYVPTGQYLYKTAYRRDLADVPNGLFVFWDIRRA
ncbi:ABC transporter substrate-binding protein [Pseudoroseomonas rhizosphaerae]|uniref:ABC transporter substrate-binding protein n=1 Tax=Teichococcus rhizosphaerae TaxID=1335062 RepID=A0A2C7AA30_9PROT|nr:ABC transporter substrate-binding protein [Pseudoroseomonas rhizosphaerae]PHK95240.1 ABC transporter substrate-binding protein [Pseudoroseomonas rhizosphaerae]